LLPLVNGYVVSPMSVMKSRTSCATSHSWRNVTSSPGSRSNTMRVAGPGIFSAPFSRLHESMNRHCGTCTSSDACWAIHAKPSTVSITGYVVVPDRWVTLSRSSQSGAELASCFSKNDGSSTPLGQRLRVTGRPALLA
jgi:hypothetical protein